MGDVVRQVGREIGVPPALAVRRLTRRHLALGRSPALDAVGRALVAGAAEGLTGALGTRVTLTARRLEASLSAPACMSRGSAFAVLELSSLGAPAVLEVGLDLVVALAAELGGVRALAAPVAVLAPLERSAAGYALLAALAGARSVADAERLWAPRLLSLEETRERAAAALGTGPLVAFAGLLSTAATSGRYLLLAPVAALAASAALLPEEPPGELRGAIARAAVPATLLLGACHLDRSTASALRAGDVVVFSGCRLAAAGPEGRASLRSAAFVIDGELSGPGMAVRAVRPRVPIEVPTMSSAPEAEVPVEVEVELARVRLTVAQLATLRIGGVLPLQVGAGDPVQLRVGDRAVARAELVDIEGELGARVLALFD